MTYPGCREPALKSASVVVRRGEMVALVGVNGAGKSTMVNALLGIIDMQSGKILIDGHDASRMSQVERLSYYGLLTQEFGRYELTVRQAVQLGHPSPVSSDAEIWEALRKVHIDGAVASMPHGLDSQLGQQWGGKNLSGGQWQRLALARIYLRNAGVWLLDEPTSAIDAEAESEIFAELANSRAARITVVVSHRAWTLKRMDRIYVFEGGEIVEEGTYSQLLNSGGRFSILFDEQTSNPELMAKVDGTKPR